MYLTGYCDMNLISTHEAATREIEVAKSVKSFHLNKTSEK